MEEDPLLAAGALGRREHCALPDERLGDSALGESVGREPPPAGCPGPSSPSRELGQSDPARRPGPMGTIFRHTWGPSSAPELRASSSPPPGGCGEPGDGRLVALQGRASWRRLFTRGPSTDEPCRRGSCRSGAQQRPHTRSESRSVHTHGTVNTASHAPRGV